MTLQSCFVFLLVSSWVGDFREGGASFGVLKSSLSVWKSLSLPLILRTYVVLPRDNSSRHNHRTTRSYKTTGPKQGIICYVPQYSPLLRASFHHLFRVTVLGVWLEKKGSDKRGEAYTGVWSGIFSIWLYCFSTPFQAIWQRTQSQIFRSRWWEYFWPKHPFAT